MPTQATYNGVVLLNATAIAWEERAGTEPYATVVVVAEDDAPRMRSAMGNPGTLSLRPDDGTQVEAKHVYVIDEQPTGNPHMVGFVLADKRWRWARQHVLARFNVRRRTGDRRLLREGFPAAVPGDVADYGYEVATLVGGKTVWSAREILLHVLALVDGDAPQVSGLPTSRSVPVEGLEIDDAGPGAVRRALDHVPGVMPYVGLDGKTYFVDTLDLQAGASVLRRHGSAPVVGQGTAAQVNYAGVRPAYIDVLFTPEQELKFTSLDEGGVYSTRGNRTKFCENVLPVPDLTLTVGGRTVTRGTFITLDEAFAAWGAPSGGSALSASVVQRLWVGGRLEAVYTGLGNLVPEVDWAARIRAVRRHYRQTYRVSQYWMNRIRRLTAERVAVIDPENGVRAPAFVTANYAYAPSVRGRFIEVNRQGIVINVLAYSDSLAAAKQAPATVTIEDDQLGIIRLDYSTDALATWETVYPCAFAEPIPQMGFGQGNAALTVDGTVYQGAAPALLAASHKVGVVVTAVPSAPNSNDQLYRVRVQPADARSVGVNVGEASGPPWTIRVGHGITTARFAWSDAQDANIDRFFGANVGGVSPGERPTYQAGDALKSAGLLVNGKECDAVAVAMAASLWSQMLDKVVGSVGGDLDSSVHPTGNATTVQHVLAPDGALNTILRFDRKAGAIDMLDVLDNSTRRIIFQMVQQ